MFGYVVRIAGDWKCLVVFKHSFSTSLDEAAWISSHSLNSYLCFFNLSSLNQILFESRITKESGTVSVGNPLTTSCNDVWLARKGHAIKPPIGSFHSHDFQIVMGFILSGNFPR